MILNQVCHDSLLPLGDWAYHGSSFIFIKMAPAGFAQAIDLLEFSEERL